MMKYRVSKHFDSIKKMTPKDDSYSIMFRSLYCWFDTYEEAKQFVVTRAKDRIIALKKEIKSIEKKLPKLELMQEKSGSK